jgi:hypothetical protein
MRLEGWPLAQFSPAAILRDATLRTAPQDEVHRYNRNDSHIEDLNQAPLASPPASSEHICIAWARLGRPNFAWAA